jgi:ketosteroid isomerase-like protein
VIFRPATVTDAWAAGLVYFGRCASPATPAAKRSPIVTKARMSSCYTRILIIRSASDPTVSTQTQSATNTASLDHELNEMVLGGKALDAFEKFYAEDVVMQENNDEPRVGKDVNRKAEQDFFSSLQSWNDGKLEYSAVNGDVTFSQWYMDVTFKNGQQVKMTQVAVRQWKNGQIAHERFFYHKG